MMGALSGAPFYAVQPARPSLPGRSFYAPPYGTGNTGASDTWRKANPVSNGLMGAVGDNNLWAGDGSINHIALGDFNGDGLPDMYFSQDHPGGNRLFTGGSGGSTVEVVRGSNDAVTHAANRYCSHTAVADFNEGECCKSASDWTGSPVSIMWRI